MDLLDKKFWSTRPFARQMTILIKISMLLLLIRISEKVINSAYIFFQYIDVKILNVYNNIIINFIFINTSWIS